MAINDDYLNCKSYDGQEADPKNAGFTLFQDKKTEKYYFSYQGSAGAVLLRSEGYTDVSSRSKGITSVKKNLGSADKLAIIEEGGKFYIILKAANNKEIGRSCDFKTQAAAEKGLALFTEAEKPAPKRKKKEVAEEVKAAAPVAAPEEVKREKETAEEVTASAAVKPEKPAAKKEKPAPKAKKKAAPSAEPAVLSGLHNFLEVQEYLDRPRIWDSYGITGYVKFQGNDGKHYFGVYNPDATLYLRSEGFVTEEERDSVFDLMDSIILLEENYKIENLNGRYYAVLFEENDIVAISPDFSSFIEAFVTTPGGRPREIQGTMF
ncbi:MAG: YegP family protein [Leadbetterella sp.]|nr:YegP family protein [Leadbetterella sp.]